MEIHDRERGCTSIPINLSIEAFHQEKREETTMETYPNHTILISGTCVSFHSILSYLTVQVFHSFIGEKILYYKYNT